MKRTLTLLVLAVFFLAFSVSATNLEFFILNVPQETQEESNWCWAAASVSICNYYNVEVGQEDFVETVKGEVVNEGAYISEVQDGLAEYNIASHYSPSHLGFSIIIDEIGLFFRPILVNNLYQRSVHAAHALVIDGYDMDYDMVRVMDPDSPYPSNFIWYDYEHFKSSWEWYWVETLYFVRLE